MKILDYDCFKSASDLVRLIDSKSPSCIFCSGWSDRKYIRTIKQLDNRCPVVVGLDNPWHGSLRQRLGTVYYRLCLSSVIDYLWVAGPSQFEFAKRLGVASSQILHGLYTADV